MSDTPQVDQVDLGDATAPETIDQGSLPETAPEEAPVEYLDIDDSLASKYVRVKVDGEELSVPLGEAVQGYQRQSAFTKGRQELAREREQFQRELQIARALQADPGMTVQVLAHQAGVSVEEFLGMTPAQQRQAIEDNTEDEYVDPLERKIQTLEQRLAEREAAERQREADVMLQRAVDGLKQQYGIGDDEVREVVRVAWEANLPLATLPMIYQSMAFQKMRTQQGAVQEYVAQTTQQDEQRRQAAAAASSVIGTGASANGVTNTPASQQFTNYRDAIMAAFEQHGDVVG